MQTNTFLSFQPKASSNVHKESGRKLWRGYHILRMCSRRKGGRECVCVCVRVRVSVGVCMRDRAFYFTSQLPAFTVETPFGGKLISD